MIILDHIKIFENKIYITRNPRDFPLTLEPRQELTLANRCTDCIDRAGRTDRVDRTCYPDCTDVPIVQTVQAVQTVLTVHAALTVNRPVDHTGET